MLGGGRCHFLPNTTDGSCRGDSRDLVSEAQKRFGFSYVDNRKSFDGLKKGKAVKLPLLGLFAPTDIPYDIDRKDADYPSLEEMAEVALKALEIATKDSKKGFFLMVEGSRIDHAGHGNDPAAQVHEVLAYDRTFKRVSDWIAGSKYPGVVVSTSDHETGGLAAARRRYLPRKWYKSYANGNPELHEDYPEYLWYPEVLANASSSSEYLADQYAGYEGPADEEEDYIRKTILRKGLGIHDVSDDEIRAIKDHKAEGASALVLADVISRRAQVGWTTHGHSGVDVNIYGSAGTCKLGGNHENTEVGEFLRDYLQVDVDAITKELKKKGVSRVDAAGVSKVEYEWMGRPLSELKEAGFETDKLDCYHGEFKHKR